MTSIADAYVDLHINGRHLEGETRRELQRLGSSAEGDADDQGEALGSSLGDGFVRQFRRDARGRFASAADDAGEGMGRRVAGGLVRSFTRDARGRFVRTARDLGDEVGDGLGDRTNRSFLTRIRAFAAFGRRAGGNFITGFRARLKTGMDAVGKDLKGALGGLGGLKIGAIAALVPLATSALSALAGASTALIGALAQASGSVLAFGGVLGGLIQGFVVGKIAFKDFGKAVSGDADALKALTPNARAAAVAIASMGGQWKAIRSAVQQNVFAGLAGLLDRFGRRTLPVVGRNLAQTGVVLNGFFKRILGFATAIGTARKFGTALQGNNRVLAILSRAAVPLLNGILNVFNALNPSAVRLSKAIVGVTQRFSQWSMAEGTAKGIEDFMNRALTGARRVIKIFGNLGSTIRNVFGAATPAGDGLLRTFVKMTKRLRDFTELTSTKNSIAEWAQKGIDVSGRLFKGLGAGFNLIKPLFSPDIASGFLDIFQKILPIVTPLFKGIQAAVSPILEKIGESLAKNGPKFAALFTALSPLLKGIGSVIGELVSQSLDLLGTVAAVITPVVRVISNFLGPILTKFSPIIAGVILLFGGFSAKLVGLIPVVGKFLVPVVRLASYLLNKAGPAFKILGKVVGFALGGIGKVFLKVIPPLTSLVGRNFGRMGAIFRGIVAVLKTVLAPAIRFIARYFETYFAIVKFVVEKYFGLVRAIITRVITVVRAVVEGGWRAISSRTVAVWTGIRNKVGTLVGGLRDRIVRGFNKILNFIKGIPDKIVAAAVGFFNAGTNLGDQILKGLKAGLSAAGGFVQDIGESIRKKINEVLHLPYKLHIPGPVPDLTIPAFARGTSSAPGGLALVGERGPEYVQIPRGSRVHTAAQTERMRAEERGQGDGSGNVYIGTLKAHDYRDFERQTAARQRAASLGGRRTPVAAVGT